MMHARCGLDKKSLFMRPFDECDRGGKVVMRSDTGRVSSLFRTLSLCIEFHVFVAQLQNLRPNSACSSNKNLYIPISYMNASISKRDAIAVLCFVDQDAFLLAVIYAESADRNRKSSTFSIVFSAVIPLGGKGKNQKWGDFLIPFSVSAEFSGEVESRLKSERNHISEMTEDVKEFDVVIFGATGYTGQYVVEELANSTKNSNIKWAVAGRDVQKVRKSLQHVQKYLQDIDILRIPIIVADINDKESILNMCKAAKLILNCVGPYKLYGEIVVTACIEARTHHVDISGEFSYLECTQANYFKEAREKGIYIVQACGFDSIPADYGISVLKKKFPGDLNSVEYYIEIDQGPSGRKTNIGTFLSAVYSVRDFFSFSYYDKLLMENVFSKEPVWSKYRLSWRLPPLFYSNIVKGWCLWFLGADERVIRRSQMFRYALLNERPIESHGYLKTSFFSAIIIMIYGFIFLCLSMFSFGRYLLEEYPSFFTYGQFSKDGPTRKQVDEGSTKVTLIGEGWKDKLSAPTDQHVSKPDTKLKLTITGPDPVYPLTAMCMVHSGLIILEESDKMPLKGGVLTPGVAFENTSLSKRLEERGMKFTLQDI